MKKHAQVMLQRCYDHKQLCLLASVCIAAYTLLNRKSYSPSSKKF